MSNINTLLADLFDKLAEQADREPPPAEKIATAPKKNEKYEKIAEILVAAGETPSPAAIEKIAKDPELFESYTKLAELGARPTPLGAAVEKSGSEAPPTTKREKLASLYNNWGRNITD